MTTSYLDRLLEPLTDVLTPEVAAALLDLRADAEIQAHIEKLREKANEGTLTRAEDAEYKDFVEAVDVISIIQAKARWMRAHESLCDNARATLVSTAASLRKRRLLFRFTSSILCPGSTAGLTIRTTCARL
jgi:hypothetical protein